jgi:hypothetical protein
MLLDQSSKVSNTFSFGRGGFSRNRPSDLTSGMDALFFLAHFLIVAF